MKLHIIIRNPEIKTAQSPEPKMNNYSILVNGSNDYVHTYQVQKYIKNGFWVRRTRNAEKQKQFIFESTSTGGQPIESWALIWRSELGCTVIARGV